MEKMEQPPPPGFMATSPPYPYPQPPPPMDPSMDPSMQPPPVQPPHNVHVIHGVGFGTEPQHMVCPYCRASITTRMELVSTTKTHLFALLLCLVGCWCCAPCPYCMDSCGSAKHYCPACSSYLGSSDN